MGGTNTYCEGEGEVGVLSLPLLWEGGGVAVLAVLSFGEVEWRSNCCSSVEGGCNSCCSVFCAGKKLVFCVLTVPLL